MKMHDKYFMQSSCFKGISNFLNRYTNGDFVSIFEKL